MVFSGDKGLIVELEKSAGSTNYFNCAWISSYKNEDERIFFMTDDCPLNFRSIRNVDKKKIINDLFIL